MQIHTVAVLIGSEAPLGNGGKKSAIAKKPVSGTLYLGRKGLSGDAQVDRRNHGGLDKAIHHYPYEHYDRWQEVCGCIPVIEEPGAFGENLSTTGIKEEDICIGDIFRLGRTRIQVSQGREPCWKLNVRLEFSRASRMMQDERITGWYYRVLEEGEICREDVLKLEKRPNPDWPLSRLQDIIYNKRTCPKLLARAMRIPFLSESWQRLFSDRLKKGIIEPWDRRLFGEKV